MKVSETALPGVLLLEPKVFRDSRGFFLETWSQSNYREAGIPPTFVQDNASRSSKGVLRGLHFQNPRAQGKLISVLEGEIFDVAVDIRVGSPWYGRWVGARLSSENGHQLWIPTGFAHGFCVVSTTAMVIYKCTEEYAPQCETSIRYNDPAIGIDWPAMEHLLSEKDRNARLLSEISREKLPRYV